MRKVLVLTFLIINSLALLIGFITSFRDVKTFYALWYPEKYFVADNLVETQVSSSSNRGTGYDNYTGVLQYHNSGKRLPIAFIGPEDRNDTIAVWYCKISNDVIRRNWDVFSMRPISYTARNYWFDTILFLLWLPSLLCYLYLRHKLTRTGLLGGLGAYTAFWLYQLLTDFALIKALFS